MSDEGKHVPDTITITDDRTGKTVTVPITDGVFPSSALRDLDPLLFCYDPAFLSTAACKSEITFLDGDAGILRYRGYPIEQLAEHSTYLEVSYLLLYGELPNESQLATWTHDVTHHTFIHENMRKRFVDGFHYDAHPMGMYVSALAALGTFYPESKDFEDPDVRHKQVLRHRRSMLTATLFAALFLVVYVTRALLFDTKIFAGEGWVRVLYLAILISHTILAVLVGPFVLLTLRRALRGQFARHRQIARVTFPMWLYVVVTGWVIYVMLHALAESTG